MTIAINGQPHDHPGEGTLAALIEALGAPAERVAVMLNDAIVPRENWSRTPVRDGDRVDVLTFMGGG